MLRIELTFLEEMTLEWALRIGKMLSNKEGMVGGRGELRLEVHHE